MVSRTFIISYLTLLITIIIGYWLTTDERPDERFLTLSTLGKNDTAGDYYPSNNNNTNIVLPGQMVSWNIYVYNHAESAEYVSVRIKLLNSTDTTPDENYYSGNPRSQYLYEFRHLLARNSTWNIPLDWMISNVSIDPDHGHIIIGGLDINNHHVEGLNVTSLQGKDFRMIIELWKYNMEDKAFVFQGFPENDNNGGAWNQIWFSLKV
ncbi:MAG TPA: hypothetical protein VHF44_01730 [Nitrososphaeraceae archaeon]|nr:hypothetical protein [Nitrososphaeraceae archaeon]